MKKRIRLQGILIFAAIIISILLSKMMFPAWRREALDELLDALGIAIVLFGFLIRIAARGYKAEKSSQGQTLIIGGLYSIVRHPMYWGTLLIGLGITLSLLKWWSFLIFFACFLSIYIPQINKEETELNRRFGSQCRRYFQTIPKYFPNLLHLFNSDPRDFLFFKWQWVKKELRSLLITLGLIIAIETWEDVKLFGAIGYNKEVLELLLIIIVFSFIITIFHKRQDVP